MAANWVASGMSMLPGLAPRPQHHIIDKKNHTEEVQSTSNALFVYIRNSEHTKVNVKGKVGKVTLETTTNVEVTLDQRIVSGTLEVIKCHNVNIRLIGDAEVPTFQVDDSTNVTIEIEQKPQIERLYYIRCKNLQLLLNGQKVGEETDATLKYDIPTTDERAEIQQLAHWNVPTPDAEFVTETVVREGIYPTTAQMKKAAKEREEEALEKMAGMLVDGISIGKPGDKTESSKSPNKPRDPETKSRDIYGRNTEDDKKEHFDEPEVLSEKLDRLAEMIKESSHTIFFTGAGISTSAGIPDFRSGMNTVLPTGPGAWELRDHRQQRSKKHHTVTVLQAIPTSTHMSIVSLLEADDIGVKYVVSQNTDGLHLRSGVDGKCLSELHGNTNLETCSKCKKKYLRDFRTRNAKKVHDHKTGRYCADPKCRGELKDSIINFGESLPEKALNKAYEHAEKADLCICLGSSLTVSPANEIPENIAKRKKRLVIVNLQTTPLHRRCDLAIHALCDDVMNGVMQRLNIDVRKWYLRRRIRITEEQQEIAGRPAMQIKIIGLDLTRDLPYSMIQKAVFVTHRGSTKTDEETVVTKQPFVATIKPFQIQKDKITYTLHFNGHYNEAPFQTKLCLANGSAKKKEYELFLSYDVQSREWTSTKK